MGFVCLFNKKCSFWRWGNKIGLIQEHLLAWAMKVKISRNKWKSWLKEEFGSTSWRLDWTQGRHAFLKCFWIWSPEIPENSVPHYENSVLSEWGLGTSYEHIFGKEVDPTDAWSLLLQNFPLRMGVCVYLRDESF